MPNPPSSETAPRQRPVPPERAPFVILPPFGTVQFRAGFRRRRFSAWLAWRTRFSALQSGFSSDIWGNVHLTAAGPRRIFTAFGFKPVRAPIRLLNIERLIESQGRKYFLDGIWSLWVNRYSIQREGNGSVEWRAGFGWYFFLKNQVIRRKSLVFL